MLGASGEEYLSVDEIVLRYRVSRRTVFRAIADGKAHRVRKRGDRRTLISVSEADALFQAVRVEARRRG